MYLIKWKTAPTIKYPENVVVYYIFIVEQYKSPGTGEGGGGKGELHPSKRNRVRVCGSFIQIYYFPYRIYDICDKKIDTFFTWPLDQYPGLDLFYS